MNQIIFHDIRSLNRLIHIDKEIYIIFVSCYKPREKQAKSMNMKK